MNYDRPMDANHVRDEHACQSLVVAHVDSWGAGKDRFCGAKLYYWNVRWKYRAYAISHRNYLMSGAGTFVIGSMQFSTYIPMKMRLPWEGRNPEHHIWNDGGYSGAGQFLC